MIPGFGNRCPSDLQLSVDPWATGPKLDDWQRRQPLCTPEELRKWQQSMKVESSKTPSAPDEAADPEPDDQASLFSPDSS
jgi:hypothetical protein